MGYPRGLIRYSTHPALKPAPRKLARRSARPRVLAYAGVLLLIAATAAGILYRRAPLEVDVVHDRVAASDAGDGAQIDNVYRLRIVNRDRAARALTIRVSGLPAATLLSEAQPLRIEAGSTRLVAVRVRAPREALPRGVSGLRFTVEAVAPGQSASRAAEARGVFTVP